MGCGGVALTHRTRGAERQLLSLLAGGLFLKREAVEADGDTSLDDLDLRPPSQ